MASRDRSPIWRRAQPLNYPLPITFRWVARLPREVRPLALLELFPRVANVLAQSWDDQLALHAYIESLLVDRRGGRRGFPPEVNQELVSLRDFAASRNVEQQGRIAVLVKAIDQGESIPNLSQMVTAHLAAEPALVGDDFLALRSSLGKKMDEAGFGTAEWDGYQVILEMLDGARERSLRANSERAIADREGSATFLIDRILHRAVTIDEGRVMYDPGRLSHLVALAEERGLLVKLGEKGAELRSLGDFGKLVGAHSKR